jgi:hypothetical protein
MWRKYDHVDYFPSYEIITGSFNRGKYFGDNLRDVTEDGVAHVMGVFMRHYTSENPDESNINGRSPKVGRSAFFDIVCDEEEIAKF